MTRDINVEKREPALRVGFAHNSCASKCAQRSFRVVRYKEVILNWRLEALDAVPRHVLNSEQSAVAHQDVVETSVAYDGALAPLDHRGKNRQSRELVVFKIVR